MNKEITVMLLTHNSKNLVIEFIKKIYEKYNILIIDNSNDLELKKTIHEKFPKIEIHIIDNNGYGSAINYGCKFIKTEYFLISNPDVKGVDEEILNKFISAAKKLNNKFSALGPRYINVNPKSHKQSIDNNYIAEMKFISGACMFFNKKNFELLNGFDENIFLYFEENDFCKRSHKINKNYQINDIKVEHDAGNSVETKNDNEKVNQDNLRTWHFIWSKFYYFKKHYGFFFTIIYFIPIIIRINYRIILYKLKNDKDNVDKYKVRRSGLYTSILGQKSSNRI